MLRTETDLVDRLVHRHYIRRRRDVLQVVARRADPSPADEQLDVSPDLIGDALRRAERHGLLIVHRAVDFGGALEMRRY